MKNKVVLFHPPYDGPPLGPPLSLLSLASPLLEAGFQVSIVDAAIDPEYKSTLASEITDALCLGISLLTGRMIRSAVDVSRFVREIHPGLPIIYGGWHPSLLPAQTLREDYVDAVVRGQGELTLRELAERLRLGSSLESVRGVSFKPHGESVHNAERPVESVERLPTPAFAMANFDAYEKRTGVRTLPYASSVGCPYACHYCTDQVFYNRRFNAYSAAPRGFRGHRTRGALSLERSAFTRLQLPGKRQAGRGNCPRASWTPSCGFVGHFRLPPTCCAA